MAGWVGSELRHSVLGKLADRCANRYRKSAGVTKTVFMRAEAGTTAPQAIDELRREAGLGENN